MKVYIDKQFGYFYHKKQDCSLIQYQPKNYSYEAVDLTDEIKKRYLPCSLCTKKGALHHG